jgi:hypothetical protein
LHEEGSHAEHHVGALGEYEERTTVAVASLEKLISRVAPGRSVRSLCHAAGMPQQTLAYWLRPSTNVDRMPPLQKMREIAICLPGADITDVSRAFAEHIGLPLHDDLTDNEHALLLRFRQLSHGDQERVLMIVKALLDM